MEDSRQASLLGGSWCGSHVQLIFTCSYKEIKGLHSTLCSCKLNKKVKEIESAAAYRILHRTV